MTNFEFAGGINNAIRLYERYRNALEHYNLKNSLPEGMDTLAFWLYRPADHALKFNISDIVTYNGKFCTIADLDHNAYGSSAVGGSYHAFFNIVIIDPSNGIRTRLTPDKVSPAMIPEEIMQIARERVLEEMRRKEISKESD